MVTFIFKLMNCWCISSECGGFPFGIYSLLHYKIYLIRLTSISLNEGFETIAISINADDSQHEIISNIFEEEVHSNNLTGQKYSNLRMAFLKTLKSLAVDDLMCKPITPFEELQSKAGESMIHRMELTLMYMQAQMCRRFDDVEKSPFKVERDVSEHCSDVTCTIEDGIH